MRRRPSPGAKRERRVYAAVATALVVVAGIAVFFAGLQRRNEGQAPVTSDGSAAARPTADPDRLVLFYVAQNGLGLITQERRVTQLGRQDTLARARRHR